MNIIDATKSFYSNYANFSGRATRSEFWWAFLSLIILTNILLTIHPTLYAVYALASIIPAFALAWRRNRDAGFSGWLSLIPLVCLYFFVQPSKQETA